MAKAKVKVTMDQQAINRLTRPGGMVREDIEKRARRVQRKARALAPKGMRRFIKTNTASGHVRVECNHPATLFVIKGTRRHFIRKGKVWRGRKVLRFKIGGRWVYARWVDHPGTKPNDFMTKALREAK